MSLYQGGKGKEEPLYPFFFFYLSLFHTFIFHTGGDDEENVMLDNKASR